MTDVPKRPDTRLVHSGRRKEWRGKLVNPPIHRGSTILFDSIAELRRATPGHGSPYYGLHGTPTQWALSEALTELEPGAEGTMLVSTGLAAVTAALMTVLSASDELLMVDSVYRPTRHFCDGVLARYGIATRYYDPLASADELAGMTSGRTKAIFMESPGSLTFEVQDVPGICAMARAKGIATLLDNTWATPLLFPAMAAGVDLSILALTKYVGGHSDLLLGSVTANEQWFERLQKTVFALGHSASADDSWLAARGLRTMGVRLRQHEASALQVARWLKDQSAVARVLHPAMEDCPGHEHWQRDFRGSAGLFAFALAGVDKAGRDRFVERLELFGMGYSWGGFESLAVPVDPEPVRSVTRPDFGGPLVRLNIGLEDPDDLITDLGQAFAGLR